MAPTDLEDLLTNQNMLEYETQIFLDLLHQDGLVVCAKGLVMDVVLTNLLKVYCDPANLVLVIKSTEYEERYLKEKLNNENNVHSTNLATNISVRQDLYLSGGVHFVTTRVLVVDMLKKRIPIEKITGIVVLRAHTLLESHQEALILRLYRENNKTGFIKAFSSSAQGFMMDFASVERTMRTIFVKELYIWPRFHSTVIRSLKKQEPQVIELHVPISETMKKVQTCFLDLMNFVIKEIKKINKTVEMQEVTVENCLTKKFHKLLQSQLDGIRHQLSPKTHQLISELEHLNQLIILLFNEDVVSFYAKLKGYYAKEYAINTYWVFDDAADHLLEHAKRLVYTPNGEFNPEFGPKWNTLSELLKVELPNEIRLQSDAQLNHVLILCQDKRTCYQLNQLLTNGPESYLFNSALDKNVKVDKIKKSFQFQQHRQVMKNKVAAAAATASTSTAQEKTAKEEDALMEEELNSYVLSMSQQADLNETKFENIDILDDTDTSSPKIIIQTFKENEDSLSLQRTLEQIRPQFVIMYQCDVMAVRQIEVYEARRRNSKPLKVYFLIHTETVEEQSYLTSLRREKEAFDFLINTKSRMVIAEDQDGKFDTCIALQRGARQTNAENTRHGGNKEENPSRRYVIVDIREFRSELPVLIYKQNIDLEPLQITVGDYILTKDICVERKSVSDLIGSLNSGRLHKQCTQMFRCYAKPMLLIEFDPRRHFNWQNNLMLSNDASRFDVLEKLQLLTLHFPKLKIIWSPSPLATAQLFDELKQDKEQPDCTHAMAVADLDLDIVETKYNRDIYDFVQQLPGINSKNIDAFMRNCTNLEESMKLSQNELKEILGNAKDAAELYNVFHTKQQTNKLDDKPKYMSKGKSKFARYKKN